MKRTLKLFALASSCLVLVVLNSAPSRSEASAQLKPEKQKVVTSPMVTSTVNLINKNWNRVTVEARIGDNANPEANRSLGTKELKRTDTWAIPCDENVWYRREARPDQPDGKWGNWAQQPCSPNRSETYNVNLL